VLTPRTTRLSENGAETQRVVDIVETAARERRWVECRPR
jgi:hypothetical protein